MKSRLFFAGALAFGVSLFSQLQPALAADGVILITTRKNQDNAQPGTPDAYDQRGPGQVSQGDVAMQSLLGDYGYSCRLGLDVMLDDPTANYLAPINPAFNPILVIVSGSSGSQDVPQTRGLGIPVIMGEHSCLGNRTFNVYASSIRMYNYTVGTGSGNDTAGGQYMRVTEEGKKHPILQGIPLETGDKIKIFRDAYPEENAHVPVGGKNNYVTSWTWADATTAAGTDTKILSLLDSNPARAVFAVNDIGGRLGDPEATINTVRLVHWIVNEDGSGGSRRAFNALTDTGRLIFVRTVKWALGETLAPVPEIRIKDVTTPAAGRLQIQWDASALKNYKILASTDVESRHWQTIVQDIRGVDGTITRMLDISAGPVATYLALKAAP